MRSRSANLENALDIKHTTFRLSPMAKLYNCSWGNPQWRSCKSESTHLTTLRSRMGRDILLELLWCSHQYSSVLSNVEQLIKPLARCPLLASNPGFPFRILSRSFGSCETKSGTESLGSRLARYCVITLMTSRYMQFCHAPFLVEMIICNSFLLSVFPADITSGRRGLRR